MAHSHSITENPSQLAGIAALSAAIGALTAILMAPRSGAEARHLIRTRASDMRSKMHESKADIDAAAEDAKEMAAKGTAKVKDAADKQFSEK